MISLGMIIWCFPPFISSSHPYRNLQFNRSPNRLGGQHPDIVSASWHVHSDRNLRARNPPACRSSTHLLYCGACKSFQVYGAHEQSHFHYDWYNIKVLETNTGFVTCDTLKARWLARTTPDRVFQVWTLASVNLSISLHLRVTSQLLQGLTWLETTLEV